MEEARFTALEKKVDRQKEDLLRLHGITNDLKDDIHELNDRQKDIGANIEHNSRKTDEQYLSIMNRIDELYQITMKSSRGNIRVILEILAVVAAIALVFVQLH